MKTIILDSSELSGRKLGSMITTIISTELVVAKTVGDAIRSLNEKKTDLLITEWELYDLPASSLINIMKKNDNWKNVPILICTSSRDENIKVQAKTLGASEVFFKPLNQQVLKHFLKEVLPDDLEKTPKRKIVEESTSDQYLNLRERVSKIERLAPLPILVQKISTVSSDPKSSARDLGKIIKQDQTLTARILKIVNSAYYGFYRKVSNIDQAIVILGFEEVKNITMAASLMHSFNMSKTPWFPWSKFWAHSLSTGFISKALSVLIKNSNQEDAFAAGLMHDIGKVILGQYFPEVLEVCFNTAISEQKSLVEIENKLTNMDHTEIGQIAAENWRFPNSLVSAIAMHHTPTAAARSDYLVHCVHIANNISQRESIGLSGNPQLVKIHPFSLSALGIDSEHLDEVLLKLKVNFDKLRTISFE